MGLFGFIGKKIVGAVADKIVDKATDAAIVGAMFVSASIVYGIDAAVNSKKAFKTKTDLLSKYDAQLNETKTELLKLGKEKVRTFILFTEFTKLIAQIENNPKQLDSKSKVDLPISTVIDFDKFTSKFNNYFAKVDTTDNAPFINLAVCGTDFNSFGKIGFGDSFYSYVNSFPLDSEEKNYKKQLKKLKKEIDNSVNFLVDISFYCPRLQQSFEEINKLYERHINNLKKIVSKKTNYSAFSKHEVKTYDNTVKITLLLRKMIGKSIKFQDGMGPTNQSESFFELVSDATIICDETKGFLASLFG